MTEEPDRLDNPNQQVVRADQSGPAEEGTGGSVDTNGNGEPEPKGLDDMTKDELIQVASERGLDVNAQMTKAEIRAVIDHG